MPQFKYKARNPEGRVIEGTIEAETEDQGRAVLRGRKLTIMEIAQAKGRGFLNRGPKVSSNAVVLFSRQLATMVSSGLPLPQAIGIIAEQSDSKAFKGILLQVRDDVTSGSSFPEALAKHPSAFNSLYVNMVKAGDIGGNLDTILERLSGFLEKAEVLRNKTKAAMIYPAAITVIMLGVVAFLLIMVVPTFKDVFTSFGAQLPLPTRIVISASEFLQHQFLVIIGVIVAIGVSYTMFKRTETGVRTIDAVLLKLPLAGSLLRRIAVSRFSRTLATLLSSGVPILDGLDIVARTAGNKIIEEAIFTARGKIREGEEIAAPLKATGVFPPMVIQMISAGQETGKLDAMLYKIADFYDQEVDTAVEGLLKLIEPIMIVCLGIVAGGFVLAMYLPMFQMSQVAGG
ncbi:MAG: type II secretion system F family protein [Candidatus Coatesbacteria bacterium]